MAPGPVERRLVVLGLRQVGEVVEAADVVDGVVELLLAHAGALDVAQALRPAVVVGVELVGHVVHVAHREVDRGRRGSGRRRSSARSARRCSGTSLSRRCCRRPCGAEADRPVGDDLVGDLAGVPVERSPRCRAACACAPRSPRTGRARRPRTPCTRRRSRRSTGSPASPRRSSARAARCPRAAGNACPGRCRGSAGRGAAAWGPRGSACPSRCRPPAGGRRAATARVAASRSRGVQLARERAVRVGQRGGELGARRRGALVGARRRAIHSVVESWPLTRTS